jgi:UDP-N-acetyl-D-glucosamine dehydrogenase
MNKLTPDVAMHDRDNAAAADALAEAIRSRNAVVGVMGLGYVGIPLALAALRAEFQVLGFDINENRVAELNRGESSIKHIPSEVMAMAAEGGQFRATTDFDRLSEADVLLICVPTPLTQHREPDLSYVENTTRDIARRLRPGQLIVLESTTYPGTTEEVMKPILERSGLKSGTDFFLAYSPEREDPGNPQFGTVGIPKVVGGAGPEALNLAREFYNRLVVSTVPVSSCATAEAVKLTENIFRAVNIALMNELKMVYEAMGIDVWEVIEAAKTKPFGFMPFYPGPGLGGHCIPIDPFYLTWKARQYEIPTRFIELAGEINTRMPRHVVERLRVALDRHSARGLNGARILIVGLAYKKNVDDVRESASLKLIELIEEAGANVAYHDPYIPAIHQTRNHQALAGRRSVPLTPATLSTYDAALIATDHDSVDYGALVQHSKLVVDTRNACERAGVSDTKVVKA